MIAVLRLLKVEDITVQVEATIESDVTASDKQSAQNLKNSKRPKMNFHELGIPAGSILVSKDGQLQVTVVDDRRVNLDGALCSLTSATKKLLGLAEGQSIQPSPYWTFNGRTVKEIYEEFHDSDDEG